MATAPIPLLTAIADSVFSSAAIFFSNILVVGLCPLV